MLFVGRTLTVLLCLFFLLDASMKIVKAAPAMEGTMRVGYPAFTIAPIGWTLLICLAFYVIPQTSILGAILLTGYLGGATAPWYGPAIQNSFFP
jgi:4-hydroxybenzoate polyprenyltransferase